MSSILGNGKLRKDQTDHYGRIKRWEDKGDVIEDSEQIKKIVDPETAKTKLYLENNLSNKIANSLQAPIDPEEEKTIVGVDEEGTQIQYKIGEGLEIVGDTSPYTIQAKQLVRSYSSPVYISSGGSLERCSGTISFPYEQLQYAISSDKSIFKITGWVEINNYRFGSGGAKLTISGLPKLDKSAGGGTYFGGTLIFIYYQNEEEVYELSGITNGGSRFSGSTTANSSYVIDLQLRQDTTKTCKLRMFINDTYILK